MTIDMLNECRRRINRLRRLEDSIERITSSMLRVTPVLSHTPTSRSGRAGEVLAAKLDALQEFSNRRDQQILELEDVRIQVELWIETLPEAQADVIYWRYVKGLAWRTIAKKTRYTEDNCYKLHSAALKKCEKPPA